ncbi:unnamed protein product [Clavelina lepadiformis]|uniref:B30.2/SPRY domain-containing protein n=1 Tax=Clavelina lepadiformis TaxID=159417 RepID=A0ABP0GW20_CLALP
MSALQNQGASPGRTKSLHVPQPLVLPSSNPYFQKLPPLSPRSMKGFDTEYNLSPDFRRTEFPTNASTASTGSSTSSSEYLSEFQRKTSQDSNISNTEDINFFLQVVGVFRDYVTDQIQALENQFLENQKQLEILQKEQAKAEEEAQRQEVKLSRDITQLVSLLNQKQPQLKEKLKKHNGDVINEIRNQVEQCKRNMKLISGILSFAKRIRNESGESLKENAVKELKQRLTVASELPTPTLPIKPPHPSCIDSEALTELMDRISLIRPDDIKQVDQNGFPTKSVAVPVIIAAHSSDDTTSSSIMVRWQCEAKNDAMFQVNWHFSSKREDIKGQCDCTIKVYVIEDLPANCDITVRVRLAVNNGQWSDPAFFRTRPLPAKFCFDASTAHLKLKLSPDCRSVCYRGDDQQNSSPKSPARFTFALNILGNISFFSGRHYWEIQVNRDGWAVGVAYREVARNSWLGSNDASWILHYNAAKFEYKARHAGESHDINPKLESPKHYLKKVGICIDYEAGSIKFVDPLQSSILHTYTVETFREPICAAVNPFYHCNVVTLTTGLEIPQFISQ